MDYLLNPRSWPEKSYELGSVLPSFLLSAFLSDSFPRIGSLVFSENLYGVRTHMEMCVTGPDFYRKIAFLQK